MKFSDLFTLRYLGAKLGLLAAAGTSIFLVMKVLDAAAPAPTAVHLLNAAAAPMRVVGLQLGAREVGAAAVVLPGLAAGGTPAEWVSKPTDMDPGRPVALKVTLAEPAAVLACTLEARPQGSCLIKARYQSASSPGAPTLACEFDCKALAATGGSPTP